MSIFKSMNKLVILLAVILVFVGSNSVEAKKIYVGEYDDGTQAYIYDEFITLKREYFQTFFQLIVDIGKGTRNAIMYEFRYDQGHWKYVKVQNGKMSAGESVHGSVEWNIENYLETTDLFKKNFRR